MWCSPCPPGSTTTKTPLEATTSVALPSSSPTVASEAGGAQRFQERADQGLLAVGEGADEDEDAVGHSEVWGARRRMRLHIGLV